MGIMLSSVFCNEWLPSLRPELAIERVEPTKPKELRCPEAVTRACSVKKLFLNISQNS